MAIQDIRSNLIAQFAGGITVAADATTNFAGVIDNAHYELGVMFSIQVTVIGTGASTLLIQQSDDPTFATGVTTISPGDENYIGDGVVDVTALTAVAAATASATTENRMVTAGVFSNRRYLRPAIIDVGGNGVGEVSCFVTQKAELVPTEPPKP